MKKQILSTIGLIAYAAVLVKVMVFKDIPLIRVGTIMLNFGGTQEGQANYLPFTTIFPYLLGEKGMIIAGINLIGNIVLLVPIGLLLPLVVRNISWKTTLLLATLTGLAIEVSQALLHVGIFDIDDVILNALGVMVGYWICVFLRAWVPTMKPKQLAIAALVASGIVALALYGLISIGQPHRRGGEEGIPQGTDLCGGTGGNGQIISVGNTSFTIRNHNDKDQVVILRDMTDIRTTEGRIPASELKTGDRVTLVGGPNPDGTFTADTVVVCSATDS